MSELSHRWVWLRVMGLLDERHLQVEMGFGIV
jgi:hypothetical protein